MKTVFVVGAGASAGEGVEFPTGDKLKKEISKLTDIQSKSIHSKTDRKTSEFYETLIFYMQKKGNGFVLNIGELNEKFKDISQTVQQASSIDNYIFNRQEDELIQLIGKLSILYLLNDYESSSKMASINNRSEIARFENTWYVKLARKFTDNCSFSSLGNKLSNATFIIFNYDRCLEYFLFYHIKFVYGKADEEVRQILKKATFIHPYGSVGKLPELNELDNWNFSRKMNHLELLKNRNNIKTFLETVDPDGDDYVNIQYAITNMAQLVFLGFGFNQMNLELLKPKTEKITKYISVFASTSGLSSDDVESLGATFEDTYAWQRSSQINTVKFRNADCYCDKFFDHFNLSISM